jgi:ubiquinone/menaquinone biosynthesis C-methylase UbiE
MDPVTRHYARSDIVSTLLGALRDSGKEVDRLTPDDLAPVDEFHLRGREATEELASLAAPKADWQVVDVGCGIGGSSRYLANRFGCRVLGVDLTPEFCSAAEELTRLTGLDSLVRFECASALQIPAGDGSINLAWTQHAQMNIAAKRQLYREIARVVKRGGRFAFHDILAGPGGPAHFPVHWADTPELSSLIAPDAFRELLEQTGFHVRVWRDTTEVAYRWYRAAMERAAEQKGPPPPCVHLLLNGDVQAKVANVKRNLEEQRITVYQGLLERE